MNNSFKNSSSDKTKEVIKKLKELKLKIIKKTENNFFGNSLSFFKGQGIEFDSIRKYVIGDDIKNIDWKTTAKNNELYIKQFQEEKEVVAYLLFDVSSSNAFSTEQVTKREMALEIAATLAFSIVKNKDQVGLILFSDEIECHLPPKSGLKQVYNIIGKMLTHDLESVHKKTDLEKALKFIYRFPKRRGVVFIFSDFLTEINYQKALKILAQRHNLFVFHLQDKFEKKIPPLGLVEFEDIETGENIFIDTSSKKFQRNYLKEINIQEEKLKKLFSSLKIKKIDLLTNEDYFKKTEFFFMNYG